MQQDPKAYDEFQETGLAAARAAAEVHRSHLGRVRMEDWSEKGVADFVTHVDREAAEVIIARIRSRHPQHTILAEETAAEFREGAEWLWVVDPLDGTTNSLHAYPMYAASVALPHHGEPVAAAVVTSATDEEWSARRGGGAFKDGQPIRVSGIDELTRALIGTGFPFKTKDLIPEYMQQLQAVLRRTAGVRRGGSAALDLCHVATGYLDGFWELHLAPWDYAAGALIVREAGGTLGAIDGPLDFRTGGSVLAGNPAIYGDLDALLRTV